jgi:phosphoribosylformylglycinamidine synthase
MIRTGVITGYGINADEELAQAFTMAGAQAQRIHIGDIIEKPGMLGGFHILAFPGGFSFGDHLGSGLVFANMCRQYLRRHLEDFLESRRIIIGICNGFQVLVKMGMLPNLEGDWSQEVSLIHNDAGVFEDSWVEISPYGKSGCIWTRDVPTLELPVRHGEGRFVAVSGTVMDQLRERNLIALTYSGRNPNGSEYNIAGITDRTGRILGLMPHPEAYLWPQNHPCWRRRPEKPETGLVFFKRGVEYIRNNFSK